MQVKRLYHTVLKDGGITLTSRLVQVKKLKGFFVSIEGGSSVIPFLGFTPDSLQNAINGLNPYLLRGRFIGVWLDKLSQKIYIDISEWVRDREEAIQKGMLNNQIAIWDIEKGQEIYLK